MPHWRQCNPWQCLANTRTELTCLLFYIPKSSSKGVSTPYVGSLSPVNELVWHNFRFTPDICDIVVGALGRSLRCAPFGGSAASSIRITVGMSNSCCLSKNVEQMYSEIWFPERLDSEKCESSLFSIRLNWNKTFFSLIATKFGCSGITHSCSTFKYTVFSKFSPKHGGILNPECNNYASKA